MFNKFCRWLDSNRGPLVLEARALPTEPQPLPNMLNLYSSVRACTCNSDNIKLLKAHATGYLS